MRDNAWKDSEVIIQAKQSWQSSPRHKKTQNRMEPPEPHRWFKVCDQSKDFSFQTSTCSSCYLPTCTYTTTPGLSAESQLKDLDMHMRYAHGIDDGTKTNRTQNFLKAWLIFQLISQLHRGGSKCNCCWLQGWRFYSTFLLVPSKSKCSSCDKETSRGPRATGEEEKAIRLKNCLHQISIMQSKL